MTQGLGGHGFDGEVDSIFSEISPSGPRLALGWI